jgi:16S rRNA (cytosine1402-N4)-methyltransferase
MWKPTPKGLPRSIYRQKNNMSSAPHLPVLLNEIITALQPQPSGRYIDGTLGAGGHSFHILEASSPSGQLLGLDLDPQAIGLATKRLEQYGQRAIIRQSSYADMVEEAAKLGWNEVDGILLDFGVSSMQIDSPERGFSFLTEGPLDMRFSTNAKRSAADLVNQLPEDEIADIIFRYGEDRNGRKIARTIVKNRPFATTTQLADLIKKHHSSGEKNHPATRTFQALRIAVNDELNIIEAILPQAIKLLKLGGRLAVISFHSLEDRIVKDCFRTESTDCLCPPRQPICNCGHKAAIKLINRKPIIADEVEIKQNSRSRSAKLRIAEKIWQP